MHHSVLLYSVSVCLLSAWLITLWSIIIFITATLHIRHRCLINFYIYLGNVLEARGWGTSEQSPSTSLLGDLIVFLLHPFCFCFICAPKPASQLKRSKMGTFSLRKYFYLLNKIAFFLSLHLNVKKVLSGCSLSCCKISFHFYHSQLN